MLLLSDNSLNLLLLLLILCILLLSYILHVYLFLCLIFQLMHAISWVKVIKWASSEHWILMCLVSCFWWGSSVDILHIYCSTSYTNVFIRIHLMLYMWWRWNTKCIAWNHIITIEIVILTLHTSPSIDLCGI